MSILKAQIVWWPLLELLSRHLLILVNSQKLTLSADKSYVFKWVAGNKWKGTSSVCQMMPHSATYPIFRPTVHKPSVLDFPIAVIDDMFVAASD